MPTRGNRLSPACSLIVTLVTFLLLSPASLAQEEVGLDSLRNSVVFRTAKLACQLNENGTPKRVWVVSSPAQLRRDPRADSPVVKAAQKNSHLYVYDDRNHPDWIQVGVEPEGKEERGWLRSAECRRWDHEIAVITEGPLFGVGYEVTPLPVWATPEDAAEGDLAKAVAHRMIKPSAGATEFVPLIGSDPKRKLYQIALDVEGLPYRGKGEQTEMSKGALNVNVIVAPLVGNGKEEWAKQIFRSCPALFRTLKAGVASSWKAATQPPVAKLGVAKLERLGDDKFDGLVACALSDDENALSQGGALAASNRTGVPTVQSYSVSDAAGGYPGVPQGALKLLILVVDSKACRVARRELDRFGALLRSGGVELLCLVRTSAEKGDDAEPLGSSYASRFPPERKADEVVVEALADRLKCLEDETSLIFDILKCDSQDALLALKNRVALDKSRYKKTVVTSASTRLGIPDLNVVTPPTGWIRQTLTDSSRSGQPVLLGVRVERDRASMIASYLLGACSDLSMGVRLEEASYKLFAGVVSLEAGKHALSGIEPDKLTEHSLKLKDRVAMLPVSTPAVRDFPWHSLQHLRSVQSKVRHLALALRTGDRDQNYVWFSIDMIP